MLYQVIEDGVITSSYSMPDPIHVDEGIIEDYLTVGQSTLNKTYPFYVNGTLFAHNVYTSNGFLVGPSGIKNYNTNQTGVPINIEITGTDAATHTIDLQIDTTDILVIQAKGDGAGGIVDKHVKINGGLSFPLASVSADTTLDAEDYTVLVDAVGGARTITLPAAASHVNRIYNIKKIDASANTVTIDGNGAETIDGAATVVIAAQWDSYTIQSNGTGWFIV